MQGIRAAVIGTGRMGIRHIRALQELGFEIAGICDVSPEALHAAGQKLALPQERRFVSAERLLCQTDPDLVVVSATADAHCDLACLAAERGARYILCEKPMACSIRQCEKIIEAADRSGALLAVNHARRYMSSFLEAKRIVNSEEFGGLRSMTVVAGDIGLAMNGSHLFDAFFAVTGEQPVEISAWLELPVHENPRGPSFQDCGGCVRMCTGDGRRFYLDCSPDQGHRLTITYAGPFGQLTVDDLAGRMFSTVRQADMRGFPSTRYGLDAVDSVIECGKPEIVELCRSCIGALVEGHGYPTGQEGLMAVRALVAAHHSHATGHRTISPWDPGVPTTHMYPWP